MQVIKKIKQIFQFIPQVKIDDQGQFKYIQMRANLVDAKRTVLDTEFFIRGTIKGSYHADIVHKFFKEIKKSNFKFDKVIFEDQEQYVAKIGDLSLEFTCVGGGRIRLDSQQQKVLIYGYSEAYGQPDHQITTLILQSHLGYPSENCSFTNKGY